MKLLLTPEDILKIAERVEMKAQEFYEGAQCISQDWVLAQTCRELAGWNRRQREFWSRIRQMMEDRSLIREDRHDADTGLPDAGAMAGLTWFGQRLNSPAKLRGITDRATLLQAAARRSRDLIPFYEGLKAFAADPAGRQTLDCVICEQWRHVEHIQHLTSHPNVFTPVPSKAVA